MNKFKIKQYSKINGVIEIFENESLMVKTIRDMIKEVKKIIVIIIIYFLGMCYIQQFKILPFFYAVICTFGIIIYTNKVFGKITYKNSKKLGGKVVKCLEDKDKRFAKTSEYNMNLMRRGEIVILKKILKVNKMDNIQCIEEIKNYLMENKSKKEIDVGKFIKEMINLYMIPITFGIIGIYTSINFNIKLEEEIVNIAYIILFSIISVIIIVVLYMMLKIKNFSVREGYTYRRLIKLLTELLIEKYMTK